MEGNTQNVEQEVQDNAEMEAAFNAASPGAVEPVAELSTVVEAAPKEKPEVKEEEPAPAPAQPPVLSEDQARLLSAIPKLEQLLQRVDKVDGNYGEIKRLLEASQKAVATPKGAAEFEASADGDFLDKEFGEIAAGVQAKIDRSLAKIQPGMTPEQIAEQVNAAAERRENEVRSRLVKALDDEHPDRFEILKTPEWAAHLAAMPAADQRYLMKSDDLHYITRELSKFKEQRAKQVALAAKSKQRIDKAVTPAGVPRAGSSTLSEDEAAQQAFAAADS